VKETKEWAVDGDLFLSLMLVSVVVCLLQGYGVAEIGSVALGVLIQNGGGTNCLFAARDDL
jgi:hypothetical protein